MCSEQISKLYHIKIYTNWPLQLARTIISICNQHCWSNTRRSTTKYHSIVTLDDITSLHTANTRMKSDNKLLSNISLLTQYSKCKNIVVMIDSKTDTVDDHDIDNHTSTQRILRSHQLNQNTHEVCCI